MAKEPVVAGALLKQRQVEQLATALASSGRAVFKGLLNAIDDADRSYWQSIDERSAAGDQ